jgi:hypothetical protein
MYYYNILPTRNIGGNLAILTFSCQEVLEIGQIVEIEIRNSEDYGLIISQNTDYDSESVGESSPQIETQEKHVSNNLAKNEQSAEDSDSKKIPEGKSEESKTENKKTDFEIKEITKIFPFKISKQQIEFLQSFTTNTFNSPNDIWSSIFQPFKLLTKKQILELESNYNKNSKKMTSINSKFEEFGESSGNSSSTKSTIVKTAPIIDFVLDSDIFIRIMYIIRSLMCSDTKDIEHQNSQKNKQLLIIFPEKKYLDIILSKIKVLVKKEGFEKEIELLKYTGEVNKNSKETIWSMIQTSNEINLEIKNENTEPKFEIILTTRSGIFLPFSNLSQIILIDEGNSLYIQDQNSLYFDTRDAIFLLHKAFLSNLTFISTLPSLRLHNFYNKSQLKDNVSNSSFEHKKPLKLKITTLDTKSAKFGLFGWEIEQLLKKDEDLE